MTRRALYLYQEVGNVNFAEKLHVLRKKDGFTQETLAEKLNVSRQAVAKWESGTAWPDIDNLVRLSNLLHVTVDYLVKEQECAVSLISDQWDSLDTLIRFRIEAGKNTYAAQLNGMASTRCDSHDFRYEKGRHVYHDTYVGGERFAGQEAIWLDGHAVYAMNYKGRVLGETFSGDFLKEALRAATPDMPYRGPATYQAGEYTYKCTVSGDIVWFQGQEEIFCNQDKVYECCFHGGLMR